MKGNHCYHECINPKLNGYKLIMQVVVTHIELGITEVGIMQVGITQVGITQVGITQVGITQGVIV